MASNPEFHICPNAVPCAEAAVMPEGVVNGQFNFVAEPLSGNILYDKMEVIDESRRHIILGDVGD